MFIEGHADLCGGALGDARLEDIDEKFQTTGQQDRDQVNPAIDN